MRIDLLEDSGVLAISEHAAGPPTLEGNWPTVLAKIVQFLICLLLTLGVFAQTGSQPAPITGSQVPDTVAYRLVFLSLSLPVKASAEQVSSQVSRLAGTGLTTGDQQVLANQLQSFQANYNEIYNTSNNASDFQNRRDLLVLNVRDQLQLNLSTNGFNQFNSYVQGEKSHMQVTQ